MTPSYVYFEKKSILLSFLLLSFSLTTTAINATPPQKLDEGHSESSNKRTAPALPQDQRPYKKRKNIGQIEPNKNPEIIRNEKEIPTLIDNPNKKKK